MLINNLWSLFHLFICQIKYILIIYHVIYYWLAARMTLCSWLSTSADANYSSDIYLAIHLLARGDGLIGCTSWTSAIITHNPIIWWIIIKVSTKSTCLSFEWIIHISCNFGASKLHSEANVKLRKLKQIMTKFSCIFWYIFLYSTAKSPCHQIYRHNILVAQKYQG